VDHLINRYMQLHHLNESQRAELAIGLLKADVHSLEVAQRRLLSICQQARRSSSSRAEVVRCSASVP
jgi:hypothetical protein